MVQVLAKSSILLLYIRIFPSPRFRLIVKISIALICAHGFAFLVAVILQCIPVEAVWNSEIKGKCVNPQVLIYTGAGFSILEDFVIMLLPVFELRALNLSRRKRIALGFMFALGSL